MIVKDLVDLKYDTPFVIDGKEYDTDEIPRDILISVVDRVDLRLDLKDNVYKTVIDILHT